MAQYGLQPNGMVRLNDGRLWNPNDPLPADSVSAFNSTPMGSPLNGLGTMAPTAVAPQPQAPAAPAAPPARYPAGMMFRGLPPSMPSGGPSTLSGMPAGQPTSVPFPSLPAASQDATAKPSFFGAGGIGRSIAGYLGDGLAERAGMKGVYAPAVQHQQELEELGLKQQAEFQRQWALEQYKRSHPEPGSIEKNYNFLGTIDPNLASSYARSEANPMTLMTDPTSGQVGFYPKGGYAPSSSSTGAAPVRVSSKAEVDALPPGTQFIAPDGSIKVKN